MKTCSKCGFPKEDNCFAWRTKAKDVRGSYCKECKNLYTKSHYRKNKPIYLARAKEYGKKKRKELFERFLLYLETKSCIVCGESDIRTLEFDHRNPKEKRDSVYTLVSNGVAWETVLEEIGKCDILCANCHKKKTNKQFNLYKEVFLSNKQLRESGTDNNHTCFIST